MILNINNYSLKVRRNNFSLEDINVWDNKDIFYDRAVNIKSLNIEKNSSVIFLEPEKVKIYNTTVDDGKFLFLDRDCILIEDLVISAGGEVRII